MLLGTFILEHVGEIRGVARGGWRGTYVPGRQNEAYKTFTGVKNGALILEHVSKIMADTCNVNTRQKKNIK